MEGMKMLFRISETDDYKGLTELFYRNGLEITPGEDPSEGFIKCWEVIDEDTGKRIGGASLEKRAGEFVVDNIAVEKEYRRHDLGTRLMDKINDEVTALGGKRIMLVAKAPSFFKTLGFFSMDRKDAPDISQCLTCSQFHKDCFPEIMQKPLW